LQSHVGEGELLVQQNLLNYLLGLNLQGLAETILFAQNGVSKEDMLLIINEGACGNGITKIKAPSIMNDFLLHLR
jgi:3-hydroxyisobutyrate dehydrogenase